MVTLSIVIPAYNEAERLPPTLTAIAAYLGSTGFDAEVIVVDDGSSDGTAEAARNATGVAMPPQVLRHEQTRAKGILKSHEQRHAQEHDVQPVLDESHSERRKARQQGGRERHQGDAKEKRQLQPRVVAVAACQ